MSTAAAIRAVTTALQTIIIQGVQPLNITNIWSQPLNLIIPDGANTNAVNLYLYQVMENGALRNMPMQARSRNNERAPLPLALTLHYLLTAFGDDQPQDYRAQEMLGHAMLALHDNALLSGPRLHTLLAAATEGLDDQIEQIKITMLPLTLEELSKLWMMFQTSLRVSVAYEVSVLLIESQQRVFAPLPVLRRGDQDRGADAQGSLDVPFPTLERINSVKPLPFLVGDKMILRGRGLFADDVNVRFSNIRRQTIIDFPRNEQGTNDPEADAENIKDDSTIPLRLLAAKPWLAGTWTVAVITDNIAVGDPADEIRERVTNELSFALAPAITKITPKTVTLLNSLITIEFAPNVTPAQNVSLLVGGYEIKPQGLNAPTGQLMFTLKKKNAQGNLLNELAVSPGTYTLRLRVDGVDSPVTTTQQVDGETIRVFDPKYQINVE